MKIKASCLIFLALAGSAPLPMDFNYFQLRALKKSKCKKHRKQARGY